jgi:hypothetical protein
MEDKMIREFLVELLRYYDYYQESHENIAYGEVVELFLLENREDERFQEVLWKITDERKE